MHVHAGMERVYPEFRLYTVRYTLLPVAYRVARSFVHRHAVVRPPGQLAQFDCQVVCVQVARVVAVTLCARAQRTDHPPGGGARRARWSRRRRPVSSAEPPKKQMK